MKLPLLPSGVALLAASGVALLAAASCTAPATPPETFTPELRRGESVSVRYERRLGIDLVGLKDRMIVDGVPEEEPEPMKSTGRIETRVVVAFQDHYVDSDGGRPLALLREYDTLDFDQESWVAFGDQEPDVTKVRGLSPLDGRRLRLVFNRVNGEVSASYADGSGTPPPGLRDDVWLPEFLPPNAVRRGDSWSVDVKALRSLLPPGGYPAWELQRGREVSKSQRDLNRQLTEDITGTVRCTYRGRKVVDERELAEIHVRADVATSGFDRTSAGEDEDQVEGSSDVQVDYVLEGTLLWDVERGRIVDADVSGPVHVRARKVYGFEEEGERIELREWRLYEGEMSVRVTVD